MAKICSYCGHFVDDEEVSACSICGTAFNQGSARPQPQQPLLEYRPQQNANIINPMNGDIVPERRSPVAAEVRNTANEALTGVITKVERYDERLPPNYYRMFAKTLLLLMFTPLYLTAFFISLILAIFFAILRIGMLSQLFNPIIWTTVILNFFEVLVLGRVGRSDNEVIYRGIIRDDDHNLYNFCMIGRLVTGNFIEGHRVSLYGRWRRGPDNGFSNRGTLYVERGNDLDTGSSISSAFRNPWPTVFWILLFLFIFVLGLICFNFQSLSTYIRAWN